MARTNKTKYDEYKLPVDKAAAAFVAGIFPDGLPEAFYILGRTDIRERRITGAHVGYGFYNVEKPSREDVRKIKAFAESMPEFRMEQVRIDYEYSLGSGIASGSRKYLDLLSNGTESFNWDDLLVQLAANREKYVLKDGDFPCSYCGRAWPEVDAVHREIFSRSYKGLRKTFRYCSEECGVYDQMGHEG